MKNLIIYPHGLGDCLMLTPSLRAYYETHGEKLNVAILRRFKSAEIFKNNPYIDKIYYVSDAWNDFKNPQIGFYEVQKEGEKIAKEHGYNAIFLNQPPPRHKILINAELLELKLKSTDIDVFISEEDKKTADSVIKKYVGDNSYGFIQTNTGAGKTKDLPDGFGEKWLKENKGLTHFIEIGKSFPYNKYNINVQFEILRRANGVCMPDSVFYHACSGLNKDIDFVFFGRGENVHARVGNLNKKIKENIVYKI